MKHIVVLMAATLPVGVARSPAQVSAPAAWGLPRKGLVAFWAGEGNARDSAGANHGKLAGGASFAPGKVGQAFKLDGKDARVEVGNSKALQTTGDQTVAMWIKPARLGVRQNILHKAFGGEASIVLEPTGELSYMYGSSGRDDAPYVHVTSFGQARDTGIAAGQLKVHKAAKTAVKAGEWTHVAIVRDLTAGRLRWYVNGKEIVETGTTLPRARASGASLLIGGGNLKHFNGLIDEVGVWNRALTAREMAAVHTHMSALSTVGKGLVGLWLGDGDAKDFLGRHHGKAAGLAYTTDRHGKVRGAFLFNGRKGFVRAPDRKELDTDEAFTLSAWVKPRIWQDGDPTILAKWDETRPGFGDYYVCFDNVGRVRFGVSPGPKEYVHDPVWSESVIPKNQWTHLAATFDRGEMKLYFNGKLDASKTSARIKHAMREEYTHDDVIIGGQWHDRHIFDGAMDDVAIWSRALSAREIAQVARARSLVGLLSTMAPHVERDPLSDRVVLSDGKVLKGVVGNDAYELTTFFGKVRVPSRDVIGLAPARSRLWLMLADGQVLVGETGEKALTLKLPAGSVLKVPLARIRQCGYRITNARPAEAAGSKPMITLRSGQRLALASGSAPALSLRTAYATVALLPTGLVRIDSAPGASGSYRAVLAGGSTLTGTLASQTLRLKLALGPVAAVRRDEILRLTGMGKSAAPADATVMVMRNGDRLVGSLAHKVLTVRTEFGLAKVFPISVLAMTFDPARAGAVSMRMWDGSTIEGQLVGHTMTLARAVGPAVEVSPVHIASITRAYALPGPETLKQVARLVARLGAESYADRQAATNELVKMGKGIVPLLKKHLESPDAEVRQRIQQILEQVVPKEAKPVPPPEANERTGPRTL
ncbi:MAG: hypothetical protein AMK72_01300 [Planctomycetes bacterium SM23_25]|nr:MAG: hypothetical protein AMK72_01300 [Planctomycetes bacterium SM23_25]